MLPPPFTDALILTGPTGSGKTQLAMSLAGRLDAEIVSMDSMALYRRLDIGTAKPTLQERQAIRHHLIDVLEPWESASVAWWLDAAAECCREIAARGKQILIVGGTPLYLKAILCGLFDGPPADHALRERLRHEADTLGADALHERLARIDPSTARRLPASDLRRVIRALEVFHLTGQPISAWQRQWRRSGAEGESGRKGEGEKGRMPNNTQPVSPSPFLPLSPSAAHAPNIPRILWLDLPRSVLYDRINRRVEEMLAGGLIEEVEALMKLDPPLSGAARQALGYKDVIDHLSGLAGRAETLARVQTRSRNFAKRQITWFRHLPGCQSATPQLTETLWQTRIR